MSDKVHGGHQSKSSKDSFREGFKAFKEALKSAETALSETAPLEAHAGELLGSSSSVGLADLPKILSKLSQSTSVGAVMTSPTGDELMANAAFYKLTSQNGGAGGAIVVMHQSSGEQITPPWVRASSTSKVLFERLYCDGGDNEGRHLDFYCRPLLADSGEFEGAFTLVQDSSEEVGRQERLRELIGAVESNISVLKSSSDELALFLKNPRASFKVTATLDAKGAHEDVDDLEEGDVNDRRSRPQSPAAQAELQAELQKYSPPLLEQNSEEQEETAGEKEEDAPQNDHGLEILADQEPAPVLEDDETDFDPTQLQAAVDSASAFILDQGVVPFPEMDDEGPEELWQEMSDGLAGVLNGEESNAQDLNLTILEDRAEREKNGISMNGRENGRENNKDHGKENASGQENQEAAADKSQATFVNADGAPAECLVVDDIPVNQKLLVFQLKRFGLNIDTASSGSEALELIGKKQYQIVFMDCDMPRMSGYETTSEIRRRQHGNDFKLPIIGMTSHDRDGDKQKCLRSGMDDALAKGVGEQELRKTIATALGVVEPAKNLEGLDGERNFEPQELEELIQTFMYAMEMFVSSMQRAIDEKDSALVRELASSVSGPSRVLGLHDMNKVSQEMVRLSSSGDWPQVRLKYLRLKTVYMRCQDDLRKLCPQAFSQTSAAH